MPEMNEHKLMNYTKSRLLCFAGSILAVGIIWLISIYFNAISAGIIHVVHEICAFFKNLCNHIEKSKFIQQSICTISGVVFFYCFFGFSQERTFLVWEKIAFVISLLLLLIALIYKLNDINATLYDISLKVFLLSVVPFIFLILCCLLSAGQNET